MPAKGKAAAKDERVRLRAKSRDEREREDEDDGYADPLRFAQERTLFLEKQLAAAVEERAAATAERVELQRKLDRVEEKRDEERRHHNRLIRHLADRHFEVINTIASSAYGVKARVKDVDDEVKYSKRIREQMRAHPDIEYAALVTPNQTAPAAGNQEEEEEKEADEWRPSAMTVTLVHAATFENILDLIDRDKNVIVPGTEVVEIAIPDVAKAKHEIKTRGTEQLGKRKRAIGQLGRHLQTRFELERYFWAKADKTMSYKTFLNVLVTALRKFTHDLVKSFDRLDVNSVRAFGSISSHDEIIETFKTDKVFDSGEHLATTPFATPERVCSHHDHQQRQPVIRRRTFGSKLEFDHICSA